MGMLLLSENWGKFHKKNRETPQREGGPGLMFGMARWTMEYCLMRFFRKSGNGLSLMENKNATVFQ
jgi:hypothetical protein